MFLIMGMTLYTSRVILNALGEEDFGIYNIVGGVVLLFSFLNTAMTSATQRYLNIELGKNDINSMNDIFCKSMTIHIFIAILIIILGETIGLFFLNTQLNIPPERIVAANYVYQFSILTFCLQVIRVPYNATIIAYEKMTFYAYTTIVEVCLKLGIVYALLFYTKDRLILYSLLFFMVILIINIVYKIYCQQKFSTCKYKFFWSYSSYKDLLNFSGWSLFGNMSNVAVQQGINIFINIFFGVLLNAAVGIANQVSNAIYSFVSNFQVAFNPHLVKTYSSGNIKSTRELIYQLSRFSFFLYFIIALPFFICTDFLLEKWLGIVPQYAGIFTRLILIFLLIDCISAPLIITTQAIGNIKKYQLTVGIITLFNLPLSYLALHYNYAVEIVWVIRILINIILFGYRIIYIKDRISISISLFLRDVIVPILYIIILSSLIPGFLYLYYATRMNWFSFIIIGATSVMCSLTFIYYTGLKKLEQEKINNFIKKYSR